MAYTIKKVAHLSGVSVRTLHFYDEIGLLKPAYHAAHGYRVYENAQLLTLQQISCADCSRSMGWTSSARRSRVCGTYPRTDESHASMSNSDIERRQAMKRPHFRRGAPRVPGWPRPDR